MELVNPLRGIIDDLLDALFLRLGNLLLLGLDLLSFFAFLCLLGHLTLLLQALFDALDELQTGLRVDGASLELSQLLAGLLAEFYKGDTPYNTTR